MGLLKSVLQPEILEYGFAITRVLKCRWISCDYSSLKGEMSFIHRVKMVLQPAVLRDFENKLSLLKLLERRRV
ncbi:MAG: hypothetical protein ACI8ZN_002176 [Bacteroidia bacterium]|jgi:hypothetical protein